MRQKDYYEAYLDDYHKIIVYMSRNSYDGVSNRFYVKDNEGYIGECRIQSVEQTQNNYNKYTLLWEDEPVIGTEYYVVHQHARAAVLNYGYIVKTERFDDDFYYGGHDLGVTYREDSAAFALWAPTASRIKLEIEKQHVCFTYEMVRDEKGVFRYTVLDNLENATYVYQVRVNGEWKETIDPYGIASNANSLRSAVIDKKKLRMQYYPLPKMKSACDAVIYEANVRDFTVQQGNGVHNAAKYMGFIEENETTISKHTGFSYLKSLGITHVQLMPVLDFGSVDEHYPRMHYNWGYDPMQYRCLEGSYSQDPDNPYSRIFEFIKLVEDCHKSGIRVVLDVVFNHVYDMGRHALQRTVPDYFFQMNEEGSYSNGSFCGNDIDTTRKMSSRYFVETCRILCELYHIDGFRFDLMGILDIDTMNEIYRVCRSIQPDFMIYGEGWDMPSFLSSDKRASMFHTWEMPGIGHFSDRFRDVVKGKTSPYDVAVKGYCSGAAYLIDIMKNCLCGSVNDLGGSRMFADPVHVVNYVECHDNMTSWDKLKECCKEETREVRIERQKMLLAAVLLAQGIPFIHSGQEFARTKHGLHNTYEESDEVNKIDYDRRDRYADIVQCTKALIELRKEYACFRYASAEEVNRYVSFEDLERKVLLYKIKDDHSDIIVIFNPMQESFHYCFDGDYRLLYHNGKAAGEMISEIDILPVSVIVLSR